MSKIPEHYYQIKELAESGLSVIQIAKKLHYHPRTVQRAKTILGIADRRRYRVRTPDEALIEPRKLLAEGLCYAEVARLTGVHPTVLTKRIPGYSRSLEDRGRVSAQKHREKKIHGIQ